jgi:hypothetical protein
VKGVADNGLKNRRKAAKLWSMTSAYFSTFYVLSNKSVFSDSLRRPLLSFKTQTQF